MRRFHSALPCRHGAHHASPLPRTRSATTIGTHSYDSSFTTKQSIAAGGTIRVENLNGSIDVEASDNGTTTVSAVKRWRRGDPARVRILVEPGKDGATVCALWDDEQSCDDHPSHNNDHHDDHNDVSVQFTVHVAKGVKVDLNTVNGSVDVSGATAAVDAETVNGRVEVATLGGPVSAKTVNGSVRATIEHLDQVERAAGARDGERLGPARGAGRSERRCGRRDDEWGHPERLPAHDQLGNDRQAHSRYGRPGRPPGGAPYHQRLGEAQET